MSIFNGNVSPFTESNSLYERNSLSGMDGDFDLSKILGLVSGGGKDNGGFDLAKILGGAFGGGKKEEEKEEEGFWGKFTTKTPKKKKEEDAPWYQTLLTTGMEAWGHYNDYRANKDKQKYNKEKNRILEESFSASVRVDANDAEPYLNTGKGMNTTPPTTWSPGPGWTSPADNEAKQLAAERARNRERQEERDRRAADDANTTKTILYVAGGGVALVAVLLVAMKVMK